MSDIAQQTRFDRRTIAKWIRADALPVRSASAAKATSPRYLEDYLSRRWSEGCVRGRRLFQEIKARGYTGSFSNLERLLAKWQSKTQSGEDCVDRFEAAACRSRDRTLDLADCGCDALQQAARTVDGRSSGESRRAEIRLARVRYNASARHAISGSGPRPNSSVTSRQADVYQALRGRISLFENVLGGVQPILTKLPTLIADAVLSKAGDELEKGAAAVRALETAIEEGRANAIDLEDFSDADLTMPQRPDPALTLADLHAILEQPRLLLAGSEAKPLGVSDFRYEDGDLPEPIRVTVDPAFFEAHSDSVEFWTPGSPAFPRLEQFT